MENVEKNTILLLNGKDAEFPDFCDFTLHNQNGTASLVPLQPQDFVPILGKTVCYTVMAVIMNEKNEILVMQEAKKSCAGRWNLPAGKVEPNESIVDAFKREVLEETGLIAEPTTLLMVESAAGYWYRFVFSGRVTGGSIKTLSQADSESLQAKWVENLSQLSFRVENIISTVEHARSFKIQNPHSKLLPSSSRSYSKLYLRLVVCTRRKTNNRVHVLISEKTAAHFPVCEIHPERSVHEFLGNFMMELLGVDLPPYQIHGVLALGQSQQQSPTIADGFCLTILVSLQRQLEEVISTDKYSWYQVNLEAESNLLSKMEEFCTVAIRSIKIHTHY